MSHIPFRLFNLFRKPVETPVITVVSGLPRSGTSMMMKILDAAGLPILTDNLRTADANNPKGYYEFERVKALKTGDYDWLPEAQGKVVKIISALLEYLPNQYQYRIIFMTRDMEEVLSSQRQMLARDGKQNDQASDEKLAELYGSHLEKIIGWLENQPHMSTLYVSYNQVLRDSEPVITRLNQFLGGKLDPQRMLAVVDPDLYRERKGA